MQTSPWRATLSQGMARRKDPNQTDSCDEASKGKNVNESLASHQKPGTPMGFRVFCCSRDSNGQMRQSGGLSLADGSTAVFHEILISRVEIIWDLV